MGMMAGDNESKNLTVSNVPFNNSGVFISESLDIAEGDGLNFLCECKASVYSDNFYY
jgi:hypothetical protein